MNHQFFDKIQKLIVIFVDSFRRNFPAAYNLCESHLPVLMFECTKMYTIVEKSCKKHGLDKLFAFEKETKRIRVFKNGLRVGPESDYDMILYEILQEDGIKYDIKRFATIDHIREFEMSSEGIKTCNVNMLGLQFRENETGQKFDFRFSDNIFVKGNKLFDRPMVQYVLKEYHNTDVSDSTDYTLSYIDGDMCVQTITQDQHIVVEEDGLKINEN